MIQLNWVMTAQRAFSFLLSYIVQYVSRLAGYEFFCLALTHTLSYYRILHSLVIHLLL